MTTHCCVSNSRVGKIDLSDDTANTKTLSSRFDVRWYPDIRTFRNGVESSGLNPTERRDAAGIVDGLMKAKAFKVSISAYSSTRVCPTGFCKMLS